METKNKKKRKGARIQEIIQQGIIMLVWHQLLRSEDIIVGGMSTWKRGYHWISSPMDPLRSYAEGATTILLGE